MTMPITADSQEVRICSRNKLLFAIILLNNYAGFQFLHDNNIKFEIFLKSEFFNVGKESDAVRNEWEIGLWGFHRDSTDGLVTFPAEFTTSINLMEYKDLLSGIRRQYIIRNQECASCVICKNIVDILTNALNDTCDRIIRRKHAAILIQRWWCKRYYDPSHFVCRQRLLREYDDARVCFESMALHEVA